MRGSQHLWEGHAPPSKATEEQWLVVCRGAKRLKVLKASRVEIRNPFSVLEGVTEEEVDVARGDKEKEGADAVTLSQGRVLVLGDSLGT